MIIREVTDEVLPYSGPPSEPPSLPSVNVFRVVIDAYLRLVDRPILLVVAVLSVFILAYHLQQEDAKPKSPLLFKSFLDFADKIKFRALKGFLQWLIRFIETHQIILSLSYLLLLPYLIWFYDRYLIISACMIAYAYLRPQLVLDNLFISQFYFLYSQIFNEVMRLVFVSMILFLYVYGLTTPADG